LEKRAVKGPPPIDSDVDGILREVEPPSLQENSVMSSKPMSFEDAVAAGLVPNHILNQEEQKITGNQRQEVGQ